MNGIIYDLKTNKILLIIPNVVEVGDNYIIGEDASAKGVDLSKAGILVVEEEIKEGEVINPKKVVNKKNEVKSELQKAIDRITELEKEVAILKNNVLETK